jgi:hypothetical protein
MWSQTEQLKKLLHSVQKWMELSLSKLNIDDTTAERGYELAIVSAAKILKEFDLDDIETLAFLQTWIRVGFFCGFLAGSQIKAITDDYLPKTFAADLTKKTFDKLLEEPVSPLVLGLDESLIRILRLAHESSLYAGFVSGSNDTGSDETFDPSSPEKLFS